MSRRKRKDVSTASQSRGTALSLPDLVLLSLLAERPMHGYEANSELERRQIRDWVAVSRAQIYYSFDKLRERGLLSMAHRETASGGPEKQVLRTTAKGRAQLAAALSRNDWSTRRERPAFVTWLALSWQAKQSVVSQQFSRRIEFLRSEIAREEVTLEGVIVEVGHLQHEAVWMLQLTLDHLKLELAWAKRVQKDLKKRASAKNVPAS